MSARVVHFELPYVDADRARAFYGSVFDWQTVPMPEMDYTLVMTGPSGDQGPTEPGRHVVALEMQPAMQQHPTSAKELA